MRVKTLIIFIYRGLVKWYDRGLQNLWREFDSLIPCSMKDWNACKIRRSGLFRFSEKTKGTEKEQASLMKGENILNIFFLFLREYGTINLDRRITTMRKQLLSIISAFMISAVLLTGCGDTAPVLDNATPETTEASETVASETEVSDAAPEETADTATAEVSDDTDDALDTNMETATEEENKETPTESEQSEATEETGYVKPAGMINGYENPELVPKPTDYDGKSIKTMDDLPTVSCQGWDYEKHPIYCGYTTKGYQCMIDGLNNMTYYANMMGPDGVFFDGDKEVIAMRK